MEPYSVLMSIYYKEDSTYFKQSLESILSQTVRTDDLVLVCDGPLTPELDAVIEEYVQAYPDLFHIIRLPENGGLGKALNKGLPECRHELVARLDTDDISLPDRMEKQLEAFRLHPEISLLSCAVKEFQNDNIDDISAIKSLPLTHEELLVYARKRSPINHPAVMFKKSAVLAVGGYQHFPYFEDYYLWVRMLQNGAKAMNLAQPLLLMRAGQAMYSRRGGLKYLKCVYRFRKYLWKCKFSSFGDFFISVSAQTVVCLLPNRVRIFVYHKFLRR